MPSPLAAMLGGAFAPDEALTREPVPGFSPNLASMMAGAFQPPELPDVSAPMDLPPEFAGPMGGGDDLLDPIALAQPSRRRQIMESIVPLLAAGVVGAAGGGMAGATGLLQGSAAGLQAQRERELAQAQFDAQRRERALARQQAQEQRAFERAAKSAEITNTLLKQASEFDDPAAAEAWLRSVAPTYAPLGIDTTSMATAAAPGAARKLQADAAKAYEQAITNLTKLTPAGETLDPDALHSTASVTFRGKQLTLGELAQIAGSPVPTKATRTAKADGTFEAFARETLGAFEESTGRPPSRAERIDLMLKARQQWARSDDDPMVRELQLLRLQMLNDKRGAGQGDWTVRYTPGQQQAARNLTARYAAASKDFATRSSAYDTVRSAAKNETPQSQIALVFAFMKLLDPGSVVREREYATAANAAGVPERVRNTWNKIVDGRFLTRQQILGMVREAQGIYAVSRKGHQKMADLFAQQAARQGVNPWDVVIDYNASDDPLTLTGFERPPTFGSDASGRVAPTSQLAAPPAMTPMTSRSGTSVTPPKATPSAAPRKPRTVTPGQRVLRNGKWYRVKAITNGQIVAEPE